MPDNVGFTLWEVMEIISKQTKNNTRSSHVLSCLTPTKHCGQTSHHQPHTVNIVTKKVFQVLCLFSLHMLGYLCALSSIKRDQILVPKAKRVWKHSGFMPDGGYLAVVSCQGLAGS